MNFKVQALYALFISVEHHDRGKVPDNMTFIIGLNAKFAIRHTSQV